MSATTAPIIIIGMHRSGTTMLTRLLQQLGLHIGWVLQENSEALFFVERNEKLMNVCGGTWEYPEPVENLLRHEGMRRQAGAQLLRDLRSLRFVSYLGPRNWSRCGSLDKLDFPWGWKDPRNTYLLPLWLDLFPEAKIIHVYRHPMDVARSLRMREQRSVERAVARLSGEASKNPAQQVRNNGGSEETGLLYLYRRAAAVRERFVTLRRYDKLAVPVSLSLASGLALWAAYVEKCFDHLGRITNQTHTVKYEDILIEPETHLNSLKEFCGLTSDRVSVKELCVNLRPERRYAFKADKEASRVFAEFRDNEWVKKLGYDKI